MRGSFLVASDGAGSSIRSALGVGMEGEPAMQNLVNIHFSAPRLAERMRKERPAMLYFVFSPQTVAVIVAHDLNEGEFVAQVCLPPPNPPGILVLPTLFNFAMFCSVSLCIGRLA